MTSQGNHIQPGSETPVDQSGIVNPKEPQTTDTESPLKVEGHALADGRGNKDSYTSYYAGMDKTQAQKVALSSAHMPRSGCDWGMH
jgi:hypothetical protein